MSSRCSHKGLANPKLPNNNINININFSVKEKNNLFTGKKIDNCVEIPKGKTDRVQVQRNGFSMETLKTKKKVLESCKDEAEFKRTKQKKSNDYTP